MLPIEFKAFLSHRYKSPEVNLYFHRLFSEIAEIQFEVDIGSLPTNVTRLERMIRDSDAFVGIFPFAGDPKKKSTAVDLRDSSRYFRLECELAIRSRKPALVFLDRRFVAHFSLPPSVRVEVFDIQEVAGTGGSPRKGRFRKVFQDFCTEVNAVTTATATQPRPFSEMKVGVIAPTTGPAAQRYEAKELNAIEKLLRDHGVASVKQFPWPPVMHREYLAEVEELDWVVMDVGPVSMASGICGYLHGRFIPAIRLIKSSGSQRKPTATDARGSLYGGIEVGYPKDLVVWEDLATLKQELSMRLMVLGAPVERINTAMEAHEYFSRASLRKEAVFLSYSGRDADLAAQISRELKNRFQSVFDYKDGHSITPGEPWIKEIFDKLAIAKLGIPLVSKNYFSSGNCAHEAREMAAKRDAGEMAFIPLKLYPNDKLDPPSWMRDRQYMHYYDSPDVQTVVSRMIDFYDRVQQQEPGS